PRLPRRRQSADRPGAADRRGAVPDRVLRGHHHVRHALGAEAAAAARARRAGRGPGRGAGGAGQRRRPLLRRRPRGAAQRRGHAQAHHPRRRRRGPRSRRAAARRRAQRAPGRDHRARRARPARIPQRQPRHRPGAGNDDGAGAMSSDAAGTARPGAWPVYKRLLGYAGRYWPLLVASSIGMVVEALAGGAFVKLMDPLVNRGFVNPEPRMAVLLPLAIIALFVIRSLATYVTDYGM